MLRDFDAPASARVAAACGMLFHLAFFVGFAFSLFPPEMFLVRGGPATLEPGLEWVFPKLVAVIYMALSSGVAFGLYHNSSGAIVASAFPCALYHTGGVSLYVWGRAGEALNPEKATVGQIIALHLVLGLPAILSLFLCCRSCDKKD